MAYLTIQDLATFLDENEIQALQRDTENDGENKIPSGISYAENYVKDRISHVYDMATEYAKTGDNRSTTLLEILAHLAIWKLAASFPLVQIDGKRHYNYEQALADLKDIAAGRLLSEHLPKLSDETENAGTIRSGNSSENELIY